MQKIILALLFFMTSLLVGNAQAQNTYCIYNDATLNTMVIYNNPMEFRLTRWQHVCFNDEFLKDHADPISKGYLVAIWATNEGKKSPNYVVIQIKKDYGIVSVGRNFYFQQYHRWVFPRWDGTPSGAIHVTDLLG